MPAEGRRKKDKFLCLDSVHMTKPWRLLLAREWFKYLAGARTNELPLPHQIGNRRCGPLPLTSSATPS